MMIVCLWKKFNMGQEMQSCGRIFNLNLQGPGNKNQQTVRQEPLSYNDISFYDYFVFCYDNFVNL